MPIIKDISVSNTLSLEDFIDYVESEVSLETPDSVAEAAQSFAMLASDDGLLPDLFNRKIGRYLHGDAGVHYTPQSVVLGRGKGFYLRANIWMPLRLGGEFRSQEERVFSYRNTHDHNFTFMTVGYFGSGYATDLYEYDIRKVRGFLGEQVELTPLGRETLPKGRIMVFRESVDVHTQFPPEELSISLNLMVSKPGIMADQYMFDPVSSTIVEMPSYAPAQRRASAIALAGYIANDDTLGILEDLAVRAECRRTREAAVVATARLRSERNDDKRRVLEKAAVDRDEVVRLVARRALQAAPL